MWHPVFLSAKWEYLVMFNYEVDPEILKKHSPPGTTIDFFNGKALVSIVGFLFNNTKVLGIHWPGHVNFEEANLRYYIKHQDGSALKRGVGFVSEIVPKPLVTKLANLFYNEHYSNAKMYHKILTTDNKLRVEYGWQKRNQPLNIISVEATPLLSDIKEGSEEEFIFEHYYGFNALNLNTTIEYKVQHPRWQVFTVTGYSIDCDIAHLYGKEFVPFIINKKPDSVFLARGSAVTVRFPRKIRVSEF